MKSPTHYETIKMYTHNIFYYLKILIYWEFTLVRKNMGI